MVKRNGPAVRQAPPDDDDELREMASGDGDVESSADSVKPPVPKLPPGSQDLYILKYRRGMSGVTTGFIMASSQRTAELVGSRYCDSIPGCRYITVTKAVIADESILTPEGQEALRESVHKGN